MNERDEARDLMSAARRDLNALEAMLNPTIVAEEIFGFHVQQAIEKTLKAWIAALGEQYPRTHDMELRPRNPCLPP